MSDLAAIADRLEDHVHNGAVVAWVEKDLIAAAVALRTAAPVLAAWDEVAECWDEDRTHADVYYTVEGLMRANPALERAAAGSSHEWAGPPA